MSDNPMLGQRFPSLCNLSTSLKKLNLSTTQGDNDFVSLCISQDFKKLESLDISNMNLTGPYPTLRKLKRLATVRLGRNSLYGPVPFQWGGLSLATIDAADMLTPIQLPLPTALAAAQATLVSINLHNTGLDGQLQNFLLTIPDVDLYAMRFHSKILSVAYSTGNPGLKNCSIPGGTTICGNTSNVRLDVGQCITFCPPVTGCPFPPPVVIPPPICNGTVWIIGNVNNTGVTTVNISAPLEIISDYTQDPTATLEVIVDGSGTVPILVNGDASLDGSLVVVLSEDLTQALLIPIITADLTHCKDVERNFTSVEVLGDCVLTSEPVSTETGFAILVTPDTSGECSTLSSKELTRAEKVGIIVACICAAIIVIIVLIILKTKGKAKRLFDWDHKRDDKSYIR